MKIKVLALTAALLLTGPQIAAAKELVGLHPFQARYLESQGYRDLTVRKAFANGFTCVAPGHQKYVFTGFNTRNQRVTGTLCYGGVITAVIKDVKPVR